MDREVIFERVPHTQYATFIMTATDYGLILSSVTEQPPVPKVHVAEIPASDGVFDLSTALTDGEIKYSNRTLNMRFTAMHKTHAERMAAAEEIINYLHGRNAWIQLPDDGTYRYYGRCTVSVEKNPGYLFIDVIADCKPYRYGEGIERGFSGDTKQERTVTENMTLSGLKLYASADAPIGIHTRSRSIGGIVFPGFIDFTNSSILSSNYRVIELTPKANANLTIYYANNSSSSTHTIAVMQNDADILVRDIAGNGDGTLTIEIKGGIKTKIYAKSGGVRIYGINLGSLSWRSTDFLNYESSSYSVNISNPVLYKPLVPELNVQRGAVSVYGDNVSLKRLPAGKYKLYDFTVPAGGEQSFEIRLDTGAYAQVISQKGKL